MSVAQTKFASDFGVPFGASQSATKIEVCESQVKVNFSVFIPRLKSDVILAFHVTDI